MTKRILVADDDLDNRTIVREVLEAAGYDVLMATNGEEALEAACREKPDVLILDLSMPKMNGWEVAKRIRQKDDASTPSLGWANCRTHSGCSGRSVEQVLKPFL